MGFITWRKKRIQIFGFFSSKLSAKMGQTPNLLCREICSCYILQKSMVLVGPSRYLCKYYVLKEAVMDRQSPYGTVLQCPTAKHSSGTQRNRGRVVQEGQVFLTSPQTARASSNTLHQKEFLPCFLYPLPLLVSLVAKLRVRPRWTSVVGLVGQVYRWFHWNHFQKNPNNQTPNKTTTHTLLFFTTFLRSAVKVY